MSCVKKEMTHAVDLLNFALSAVLSHCSFLCLLVCYQCDEYADKLNPVCKNSGHTIERKKTVKRFFKCPECTYTPIIAVGHTLPDGCPR